MKKIYITSVEQDGTGYDNSLCRRNIYRVTFRSGHICTMIIGSTGWPDYNEEEKCYEDMLSAYVIDCNNNDDELSDDELEYLNEIANDCCKIQKSKTCSEDDDPEFDKNEEEQLISEIEEELYEEEKTTQNEFNIFYNMVKYVASPEEFIIQCNLSGENILDIVKLIALKTSCGYFLNIETGYIEFDEEGNITDFDLEIAA